MAGLIPIPIEDIIPLALKAGQAIRRIYRSGKFETEMKADRSPLTLADREAHAILLEGFRSLTPLVPVLSEESRSITYEDRKGWKTFWLVDPLDGTKEFVSHKGEFTVNIALVHGGRPRMGIIHVPESGVTYFARSGKGAFRKSARGRPQAIQVSRERKKLSIIVSRSHAGGEVEKLLKAFGPFQSMSAGSALKFCLVAEGKAQLYPRFWPSMEWDTAAGECLVEAAGGTLRDLEGKALEYNKPSLKNPYFVASAFTPDFWLKRISESGVRLQ